MNHGCKFLIWALLASAAEVMETASHAEAPADPPGGYTTSWLGNTYMDVDGHKTVTEELADICVSPGGKLFTAGYAEAWGGGAEYKTTDAGFLARYDRFESGFGDPVKAVAADNNFVFWGTPGKGLLRSHQGGGGAGSYTTFLPGKIITGLFVKDGKLFVSNFSDGRIHVFDIASMTEDRSWGCAKPTRLTVDKSGTVWVVRWSSASPQEPHAGSAWWGEKVVSFSSKGQPGAEITEFEKPLALAVNKAGQLLIGGLNKHSQIWIYDIDSAPRKVGTFGAENGIFSGVAGAFTTSAKLHWIKAIAVDDSDNIYTGCTYGTFWGNCVEKWSPGGDLQWRLFGGPSPRLWRCGPGKRDRGLFEIPSLFSELCQHRPRDGMVSQRLHGKSIQISRRPQNRPKLGCGFAGVRGRRRRIGGKLFVGRSNQEGYRFELYRQEIEATAKCWFRHFAWVPPKTRTTIFYNAQTKTWIHKPKKDGLYNQYWSIAKNGDLFSIGILKL